MMTELNFFGQKYYGSTYGKQTIIPFHACNLILDASSTGNVDNSNNLQKVLTTLIGVNISTNLTDLAVTQITKMMISHLYLLMNIFTNTIPNPTE